MAMLARREWVPSESEARVQALATECLGALDTGGAEAIAGQLHDLVALNDTIHSAQCFNLNPATNVMNARAEALLSAKLGSRPSLGYPGAKYEMGLEAIEEIEVVAAALAARTFDAQFAEIRVASGALANLYAFMATCAPGDAVIVPPATIGGHVTHHDAGCAGLFGLEIHEAPVADDGYTVDLDGLAALAARVNPRLITIGGSLNLTPHPVREIVAIARAHDARVLFDAAHQCGLIAGRAWPNPLADGADLMTMSTYKSLGGPAGGLIVTNDAALAERLDSIAFPGMTANFDAAKSAALAMSLLDWEVHGRAYAEAMIALAAALADALAAEGLPVFSSAGVRTRSHQFALEAAAFGGGQAASRHLRKAGFLACGIGLPIAPVAGDMNGLRIGTPELARIGVTPADAPQMAELIARALRSAQPADVADEVAAWRQTFDRMHFVLG
ncbi:MAG: aminotransferase class I/II-fold pyridoxal phosphate-dependent enzyme [Pseudomonadota bacterium]